MEPPSAKPVPVVVEYCPVCTLATEYCAFSPLHAPAQKAPEKPEGAESVQTEATEEKKEPVEAPAPTAKDKKVKPKPPSKLKVLIQDKKGRTLTTVSGFDTFEISGKDVSKKITKKFGCGSGGVTSDGFELQGAFDDQLVEFLTEEYPGQVTEAHIEIENKVDKKHKKKGKPEPSEAKDHKDHKEVKG